MIETACPECESSIKVRSHIRQGQQITCRRCQSRLEVIGLDPIELDLAMMIDSKRTRQSKASKRRRSQNRDYQDWFEEDG